MTSARGAGAGRIVDIRRNGHAGLKTCPQSRDGGTGDPRIHLYAPGLGRSEQYLDARHGDRSTGDPLELAATCCGDRCHARCCLGPRSAQSGESLGINADHGSVRGNLWNRIGARAHLRRELLRDLGGILRGSATGRIDLALDGASALVVGFIALCAGFWGLLITGQCFARYFPPAAPLQVRHAVVMAAVLAGWSVAQPGLWPIARAWRCMMTIDRRTAWLLEHV
jgi:hypothetical protein